jgi:hypothetical protein
MDAPTIEYEMQADSELRTSTRVLRSLGCRRAIDHQARARDDSALVRLDDSAVDACAAAEIVSVHDQVP